MKKNTFEHCGYKVEIPEQKESKRMRLTINGVTHIYGKVADGRYYLERYAYDRHKDIAHVVKHFIEAQEKEHKRT